MNNITMANEISMAECIIGQELPRDIAGDSQLNSR